MGATKRKHDDIFHREDARRLHGWYDNPLSKRTYREFIDDEYYCGATQMADLRRLEQFVKGTGDHVD